MVGGNVGVTRDSESLRNGGDGELNVGFRGLPVQNADSHDASSSPSGPAEENFSLRKNAANDFIRVGIVVFFGGVGGRIEKAH